jgi:hypothetical protein
MSLDVDAGKLRPSGDAGAEPPAAESGSAGLRLKELILLAGTAMAVVLASSLAVALFLA